ncbi:MAG: response regulator transcription factor [Chloroflexi bacterium]|nr:response regulator transcription factor [Chloroflexota bacterium]
MKGYRILAVDDEERILNFLKSKLNASGYEVLTAQNGVEALEKVRAEEPDLVLLDVLMPRMDGIETLKQLRTFSSVPVIVLSAKGSDTDKVKGLNLGADDYISKPFNPSELLARIEAVKRRANSSDQKKANELSFGDVTIDFDRRAVLVRGEQKRLTRIEWLLLAELARNAGRLMLYDDLLTRVWGPEYRDDVQILRTWVSRLRSKLEEDPNSPVLIRTVPKTGYMLDHPPA